MVFPRMIERACGGWLAVSPEGCSIRIGVAADGREEAAAAFSLAMKQWRRILDIRTQPKKDAVSNV